MGPRTIARAVEDAARAEAFRGFRFVKEDPRHGATDGAFHGFGDVEKETRRIAGALQALDLKKGEVKAGTVDKADCTLALTDADWLDMVSGKADPMKLFQSGKLKITGNVMASQKLNFLQKIDKAAAQSVVAKTSAPHPDPLPKGEGVGVAFDVNLQREPFTPELGQRRHRAQPRLDDGHARAQPLHLGEVVAAQHQRAPLARQLRHRVAHRARRLRVEA